MEITFLLLSQKLPMSPPSHEATRLVFLPPTPRLSCMSVNILSCSLEGDLGLLFPANSRPALLTSRSWWSSDTVLGFDPPFVWEFRVSLTVALRGWLESPTRTVPSTTLRPLVFSIVFLAGQIYRESLTVFPPPFTPFLLVTSFIF